MDQIGIVRRAWDITWRYKALWILGFFAGGVASNSSSGRSAGGTGGGAAGGAAAADQFREAMQTLQQNAGIVAIAVAAALVFSLIFIAIAALARAGLVWGANEAAEGRGVRGSWGAGAHFWLRSFAIQFILALPVLILLGLTFAIIGVQVVSAILSASAGDEQAVRTIFGACGVLALALVVIIPLSIVLGLLGELALRRAVLDDARVGAALSTGWADLRHHFKDVVLMALVLLGVAILWGIVASIVGAIFGVPAALAGEAEVPGVAALLGFLLFLVLVIPNAIVNTLNSVSWTVFFRRMTGREAVAAGTTAPAAGAGYPPPPPAYTPPMPPAPEPPAMPPMPPMPEPPAGPSEPEPPAPSSGDTPPGYPPPPPPR